MHAGEIINGRFEIDRLVGSGGMGQVFRARDLATGGLVAIKVLHPWGRHDTARFEREARILSDLSHPGVVRYIAHGAAPGGEPFLAMEWLEGEDLHARLSRGRLSLAESVTLAKRIAEVLTVAHAQGVVHRDLKPSNIFLVGGSPEHVKILDFGIARLEGGTVLTRSATTLGTPGYMAPEQARGESTLDARADIFALGCILFECLTGAPAFSGANAMVILAKILFAETPLVTRLCPESPPDLEALCARMLAKHAEDRPHGGSAVASALESITLTGVPGAAEAPPATALTGGEQQLVSVVMVSSAQRAPAGASATHAQTVPLVMSEDLRRVVLDHGGRFEVLADGSAVVVIAGVPTATDQAARAARCAFALRDLAEGCAVAIATGSVEVSGGAPVGAALERAGALLSSTATARGAARETSPDDPGGREREKESTQPILLDEVTAGLLEGRFEIRADDLAFELRPERAAEMGARTLLGKTTAFVGRERDLAALMALVEECIERPLAQAVVLTAPPGMGKSRLANELLRALRQRREPIEVWVGRGDSLAAGSALGMLRQALESAFGIRGGDPHEACRNKLLARVERHVGPADKQRVAEFLGELMGVPLPDEASAPLRAARLDAHLMSDQMLRAWEDFCAAECAAHPVLLVLEDLHWGDVLTVRFVDAALRRLRDSPFMVLALARPEANDLFPNLWADRGAQQMRLRELSHRASEQLVRQVLGSDVSPDVAQRIVALADGNAFFLEELIRAASEGRQAALPGTVVAMLQARLARLEDEARRVLRAASIFGEVFWRGGIEALLGSGAIFRSNDAEAPAPRGGARAVEWLRHLVEREVLVRRRASRFQGEEELSFRHALLREAAYAMLTKADREIGHRLAAEWLEQHGEEDPLALAEHFERGQEPARAGRYYARAAEQALRGGDPEGQIALARRGLACGVPDDVRVTLLKLLCEGYGWRSQHSLALPYAEEALERAAPGSEAWAFAMVVKLGHATMMGDVSGLIELLGAMRGVRPAPGAAGVVTFSFACAAFWLDLTNRTDLAQTCLTQMREAIEPVVEHEPLARGWLNAAHASHFLLVEEDPWAGLLAADAARESFLAIGYTRQAKPAHAFAGMCAAGLGAFDMAERELREALSRVDTPDPTTLLALVTLVETLAIRGALDEAHELCTRGLAIARTSTMPADEGRARWGMASLLLGKGDLAAAEREALEAISRIAMLPLEHAAVTATLAAILLAQGRAAEALAALGSVVPRFRAPLARLVRAEALHATGDIAKARAAIAEARARVLATAAKIADPSCRASFLEHVPEVARTLLLSRQWLGAAEPALAQATRM